MIQSPIQISGQKYRDVYGPDISLVLKLMDSVMKPHLSHSPGIT